MPDPFVIVIGVIVVFGLCCIWMQTLMAANQRGFYRGWEAACKALEMHGRYGIGKDEEEDEEDDED